MVETLNFTGTPELCLYYRSGGSLEHPLPYSPQPLAGSPEANYISRLIEEDVAGWRQEFTEGLPSAAAQINTERPARFIDALGLPVAPIRVVPDISRCEVPGEPPLSENDIGLFSAYLKVAFVTNKAHVAHRDDIVVHELMHGSGIKAKRYILEQWQGQPRYVPTRLGSLVISTTPQGAYKTHLGKLIEEGRADIVRAAYKRITATEGKKPDGFMPTRYITDDPDGKPLYGDWAHAGLVLELLGDKDPKVIEALFASQTSIDGLRSFAKRVNRLVPGMYGKMLHARVDPANDAFKEAVETTVQTLYSGKSPEEVCLTSGQAVQAYIDPLIETYEQKHGYHFAEQ